MSEQETMVRKRLFAVWACVLHLSCQNLVERLLADWVGRSPDSVLVLFLLWFLCSMLMGVSFMDHQQMFSLKCAATKRASERTVICVHVHLQHGRRYKLLGANSALNKSALNTIKVLILPVAINPIFAAPSLGSVRTVWMSTGIPEKLRENLC